MITSLRILLFWFLVQFTNPGWSATAPSPVDEAYIGTTVDNNTLSNNEPEFDEFQVPRESENTNSEWSGFGGFNQEFYDLIFQEAEKTGVEWYELSKEFFDSLYAHPGSNASNNTGNDSNPLLNNAPGIDEDPVTQDSQNTGFVWSESGGLSQELYNLIAQESERTGLAWDELSQEFYDSLFSNHNSTTSENTESDSNTLLNDEPGSDNSGLGNNRPRRHLIPDAYYYSGDPNPLNGNSSGSNSYGIDFYPQLANDVGYSNTFAGSFALYDNISGHNNTANGAEALVSNISGSYNTAIGAHALRANKQGYYNSAIGYSALKSNISGHHNIAEGFKALYSNTTGSGNLANGHHALFSNTSGKYNIANGAKALYSNSKGKFNTAIGISALYQNKIGIYNTALGNHGLAKMTNGNRNLAVGMNAGINLIKGNSNVYIANPGATTEYKTIRIGKPGHVRTFIGGIRGRATGMPDSVPVFIDSNGQLGTINSSARFKKDIKDMNEASHNLLKLRPVTYRYKQANANGENPIEYGLIAEEVAKVYPDLVAHNAGGQIETVQYHKLTPMLLNELQAMHKLLEKAQDKEKALVAQLADERLKNQKQAKDLAVLMQQVESLNTQSKTIVSLTERLSRIESQQILGLNR